MDESPEPASRSQGARPVMTRTRWWLAGMTLALTGLLLLAWFERRELAGGYVDDLLAERGVAATYTIADLGPGGQRLTNLVIGDPARPDLTADWVETDTRLGWDGPEVVAIRAGSVRLRGRLVDGRVSLGALDRLLPKSSGAPFALPDVSLAVADGRMRLDTPYGPVGLKLAGAGNLRNGFDGRLAAVAPRLRTGDCAARGASGYWRIVTASGAPRLTGPTRLAELVCGAWRARDAVADIDARPGERLDRADARAQLAVAEVRSPTLWLKRVGGTIASGGPWADARGTLALSTGPAAGFGASAMATRLEGGFRLGKAVGFDGVMGAERASLPVRWRDRALALRETATGTPAGPLLDRIGPALALAGRDAAVRAAIAVTRDTAGWRARVGSFESRSASSARISLAGGEGVTVGSAGARIDGRLTTGGGGLPDGVVVLTQAAAGAPITGTATFAPYRARNATLATTPITFRATPGGNTAFATRVTLSGPLGDGWVEAATLALHGGWDGRGRVVLNPRCETATFRHLSIAGLRLDPARLALCPVGRGLVVMDGGRLGGGARIAAPRLTGALGGSPLTLAAQGSEIRFGDGGLRIDGLAARLGAGATPSRLDIASLTGRIAGDGIAGRYDGAGGRIGAVPLLMSEAAGGWRLSGGVLTLDGGLTVADARTEAPRFHPLPIRDVALRLADGQIVASGQLRGPDAATRVADLTLRHELTRGVGEARIAVPALTFSEALQPRQLTPLVVGVVAGVSGTVVGDGVIRWTPQRVTSGGEFATTNMDLAAAFGPVTGLSTRVRFTDLLAMESAPDQVATVAIINPGVAVEGGEIRYQLLAGPKVQVNGARWPFAGGTLALEPSLLNYSSPVEKRLTFRIQSLDAAVFLQRFDYKNLTATGVFDGSLPMVFDESGGRIENGRLTARGGGTLAYVGEVSQENLGTWGNLAFDALKSLRYRDLDLTLNGPLAGEIVTHARFGGVAQGEGAKSNFLTRRIAKLPFVFNVRITAPFRSLLDTARSFYDPSLLMQRNLPELIEREKAQRPGGSPAAPIQPGASDAVPPQKQD